MLSSFCFLLGFLFKRSEGCKRDSQTKLLFLFSGKVEGFGCGLRDTASISVPAESYDTHYNFLRADFGL